MFSLLSSEMRKKNSLLSLNNKRNGEQEKVDMDVLHSFEKNPVSESALYAAMDTTIGAGALNPFLSQMVLMQYNDAHTRIAKVFTDKSALADKMTGLNENVFASTLVPMVLNIEEKTLNDKHEDERDGRSRTSSISSTSSIESNQSCNASYLSLVPQEKSSWHSLPGLTLRNFVGGSPSQPRRSLLHPNDCSKKRRSGVANMSLHSDGSVSSEDARFIQMKGKLLTGDEVNYSYVALNTDVEGKDTVVLYTDHPRPKFNSDLSISDKTFINSSTGLYRTMVGGVPRVLNFAAPTGIPSLDSRDSIDSGTAGDEVECTANSGGSFSKKLYNSVPNKLNTYEDHKVKRVSKYKKNKSVDLLDKPEDPIRYSYSPSFEDKESGNDISKPPSYDEVTRHKDPIGKENHQLNESAVKVCHRSSSVSQVVINQPRRSALTLTREIQTSQRNSPLPERNGFNHPKTQAASEEEQKSKFRLTNLITKKFWGSKDCVSARSVSIDSGYKHSISIDDGYITSPKMMKHSSPPTIDEVYTEEPDKHPEMRKHAFSGVMGTTVVTIENDKHRKLQLGAQSSMNKNKDPNKHSNSSLYVSSSGSVFDQNKTIEGSPLPVRKDIQLPTFFDPGDGDLEHEKHPVDAQPGIFEEYVILDDLQADKKKQDSVSVLCLLVGIL